MYGRASFYWFSVLLLSVFMAGYLSGKYITRTPDQTKLLDLTTQNLFDCRAALYRKK